jgi:hypothetical protein
MNELSSKLVRGQQKAAPKVTGGGEDIFKEFFLRSRRMTSCGGGGGCIPVYDAQGTQVGVGDRGEGELEEENTFAEVVPNNLQKMG